MWRFCSSSIRGSIIWLVIWMSPVGASGLTRGCSSRGPVSSQAISSATICQHGTDREQFPAAENPSFVPSPAAQAGAQVAGQASGIQSQSVATEPQYPANQVNFQDGKAYFNKQELNLNYKQFPDRLNEVQSPGDGN